MKFCLLINSKLLISTVVFFLLSLAECEIFHAYECENATKVAVWYCFEGKIFSFDIFDIREFLLGQIAYMYLKITVTYIS